MKQFYWGIILFALALCTCRVEAAFSDWEWSARAAGMGGAFCAVADDVSGVLYNPGGLAQLKRQELAFMYARPYMGLENVDLGLLYAGYALPVKKFGVFALTVTDYEGTELYRENMAALSFAKRFRLGGGLSLAGGLSLKYLDHRYFWDKSSEFRNEAERNDDPVMRAGDGKGACTVDAGILLRVGSRFRAGVAGRNLTRPDVGVYERDSVPCEYRIGCAYALLPRLTAAADLSYRDQEWGSTDDKQDLHGGLEYWTDQRSCGLRIGADRNEYCAGVSLGKDLGKGLRVAFDYALVWSTVIRDNAGSHRLTLHVLF